MANRSVRQVSIFLDGKQVEGSIKQIAAAFAEANNRLAKMVVGSDEYIKQLEEVQRYNAALNEHRGRIRGIGEETEVTAGSMNALQRDIQTANKELNNLAIGSDAYNEQLQKVQSLEAQLTEVRRNQQAQNTAVAGSINAMEQEYQQANQTLRTLVVGSDEYNQQLQEVQRLEAQLTETRKKQQVQNTAVAGSIRALEEELQQERNILRELVVGTKEYQAQLRKVQDLDGQLTQHQQSLKGIRQGWSLAKIGVDQFVGIAAGAFAVDTLFGYGKALFNTGVQMDALQKKARTVFGETLPQVTAEAEKNARSMGLTNAQYVAAAANIQDLLVPMGFQRKEAADISSQLVNLSGALSEWTGGQKSAVEVSEILNKALLGEREELKGLGISISEADVQAQLAAKGLEKLTGKSLEQAKAAATLELILSKSTDAQAAFANGADSAVRRQAQLTAKIQEISEKLATLLLPVFESLAAIAGTAIDAISSVVDGIESMVEPAQSATKAFNQQSEKVNDLQKNILPLLDRYDELAGRTNLNRSEQDELQKIITTVSGVIPTAIEGFGKYGEALGLNTTKAREFIEVERARLKFINQEAIQETEKFIAETKKQADIVNAKLQSGTAAKTRPSTTGFGAVTDFQPLTGSEIQQLQGEAAKLQETLTGAYAQVKLLKGENLEAVAPPPPPPPSGGGNGGGGGKDAEKLQDELTKLIERTTELRLDLISKSQDDELAVTIRGIEKRYEAEIQKATELEKKGVAEATAQRIALEKLKQEEIGIAVQEDIEKSIAENEKTAREAVLKEWEARAKADQEGYEFLKQRQQEREDAQKEIDEFKLEAKGEDDQAKFEEELIKLDEQYQQLLLLADEYFNDDLELQAAYEEKKKNLTDKYNKKAVAAEEKFQEELKKAQIDLKLARLEAVQAGAEILGSFVDQTSAVGKALFLFEKAAAAAMIVIQLQKEKAAIWAAARTGTLFDPTGASTVALATPQIIAANIRAGISLATIAATAIKGVVKQKAKGGYLGDDDSPAATTTTTAPGAQTTATHLTVTGQDDRRTYRAKVIPPPATGYLPNHPVLFQSQATAAPVLASEQGREYFVSSQSLSNPYVANLVRMIDNINVTGGRGIPQFAEGGFNQTAGAATPSTPPLPGIDPGIIQRNTQVMEALLFVLQGGITAVLPDSTLTNIPSRLAKINKASGGYYQ